MFCVAVRLLSIPNSFSVSKPSLNVSVASLMPSVPVSDPIVMLSFR